jgi:transposase
LALIRLLLGARCAPGCASHSLAVQVQEGLGRDPHAGDLYVFRGKRGHLIKILWHERDRYVALRQTAGARQVHMAVAGRRDGRDHPGAVT